MHPWKEPKHAVRLEINKVVLDIVDDVVAWSGGTCGLTVWCDIVDLFSSTNWWLQEGSQETEGHHLLQLLHHINDT